MSDYIERSEVLKQLRLNHKDVVYIDKNECARRIEAIPPAEVVPKGSDEASLAYAEGWKNGEEAERSRHKMNATGDLIERSEVLKQLWLNHKDVVYIDKNECARRIEAIPSARPKGEWIKEHGVVNCSNCNHSHWSDCYEDTVVRFNFCPNCGADMRERKDFQVIVNGNCTKCGKPLSGNRIFICEECEEQSKESE